VDIYHRLASVPNVSASGEVHTLVREGMTGI
jgi:hypothetical protein